MEETQNVRSKAAKRVRKRKKTTINEVRQQMEFYFSDANLSKDRYLNQLIANDPNVPLEVFMNFNKIKKNVQSVEDIAKALTKSEFLKLSEDRTTVCRITPIVESTNVDERTIYVESLPISATIEWLRAYFEQYGQVTYVSLPKYRASQRIKEFAFVEFEKISSVLKAINAFKKFGGLLNMESDPENLASIISYLKEQQSLLEQAPAVNLPEPEKGESNEDDGMEEVASNVDEQSEAPSDILDEVSNVDSPPAKRMKLSEDAETKDQEEHDSDPKEHDEPVSETHKSKNRNRKISMRKKRTADNSSLVELRSIRICTKIEWKRLRNKYLNEQHQQRKLLKQMFKSNKQPPPTQPLKKIVQNPRKINFYNANKEDGREIINNKIESIKTPLFTFTPGVIVKVFFDEPCADVAEFKRDLRAQSYVKYVDIEEPLIAAFVRVDEARSAPTLIKHCAPNRCQILTGDNESDYWRKMELDWKNKISKSVKVARKRGRDKLAKVVATHVRFEE
ncbi:La-related protein 7 [Pseudolycoriella hygida]|uniref:La-related protein 7 n=1 Tax=Pseudolycoriella hygida TaxID=35572 RepID=A0A9Q0S4F6_9DIPT|nr:La-related protein 7 [Pseudolycoriella hygida]